MHLNCKVTHGIKQIFNGEKGVSGDAYRNTKLLDRCGAVQMYLRSRKKLSNLGMLGKGEIIMSIRNH